MPLECRTERIVQATARHYFVSPDALGANAADIARADRLSSRFLIALGARMVREVADLARGADRAAKPLAALAIDTEIRFASAADRAAFTVELADAINQLVARYHDEHASGGRWHRLIVAAHPRPTSSTPPPTRHKPRQETHRD